MQVKGKKLIEINYNKITKRYVMQSKMSHSHYRFHSSQKLS